VRVDPTGVWRKYANTCSVINSIIDGNDIVWDLTIGGVSQPDVDMRDHPRILIADDEPAARKILSLCCEKAGFESTTAEDGLDALELASASYHLIITDHQMPRMNGLDLCRNLRLQARHEQTPIIMCSAALSDIDTNGVRRELEPIIFLPKPVDVISFPDLIMTFATPPDVIA